MTDFSGLTKVSSGGRSADAPSYDFSGLTKVGSVETISDFSGLTKVNNGGSFVPEVAKGVAAGAVAATGTALKGAAGQNAAMLQSRIDGAKARIHIMDLIDKGQEVPVGSIANQDELGTADVYKTLSPEDRKAFRRSQEVVIEQAVQPSDVTKAPLYQAGQWAEDFSKLNFPAAKDYEGLWTRGISEGLGSTVPFIAAQAVGAGGIGTAMGSAMTAGSQIEDAIKHGATREQIIEAVKLGGIPGLTEQMPIEVLFSKVPLPQMGKFATVLGKVLSQAAAEGGQEGVQQLAQNLIAKYVYNPKQEISEDVLKSAAIGGIVGGGIKGVDVALGEPAQEKPSAQAGAGVAGGAAAQPVTEGAGGPPPPSAPSQDTKLGTEIDKSVDRPNSPRLTPADRASPLPNDLIDEGKKIFEEALGKQAIDVPTSDIATPAMRAEADRRAADIAGTAAPASQAAAPAIDHTIEGTLAPAAAAGAPGAAPARLLSDAEFLGSQGLPGQDFAQSQPGGNGSVANTETPANLPQGAPLLAQGNRSIEVPRNGVEGVGGDTASPHRLIDVAVSGAEGSGDVAKGLASKGEFYASLDVPAKARVLKTVLATIQDDKVFRGVVDTVPVPVMNELFGSERAAKLARSDKAMFINALASVSDGLPVRALAVDSLVSSPAFPIAKGGFPDPARALGDAGATVQASEGNRQGATPSEHAYSPTTAAPPKATQNITENIPATPAAPNSQPFSPEAKLAEPAAQTALKQKIKAKRERAPLDLVQFLASEGGIADHKGEIASLGLKNHFVPGIGKLMRATGMNLDRAREAAQEAGYITPAGNNQTTTVGDLLRAIDENMRGNRVYSREDAARVQNKQADKAGAISTDEAAKQAEMDSVLKEYAGILTPDEISEIERMVGAGEMRPDEAAMEVLERNAVAFEQETHDSAGQGETFDVPFDDQGKNHAGAKPADKVSNRQGSDQGAEGRSTPPVERAGRGEPAGSQAQKAPLATERGADNKPQTVIPGAERISQQKQAQREADKPMRPKVPQKDAGALFDGQARSEKQREMFSFAGSRAETLNRAAFMRAQDMRDAGASRDDVYDATGFFVGPDGRWRFEISDADAKIKMGFFERLRGKKTATTANLSDVLDHAKLFKAYPALADYWTSLTIDPDAKRGGSFEHDVKRIEVTGRNKEEALSILLHEVAHAIQGIEGFARGGSGNMGEIYDGPKVEAHQSRIQQLSKDWEAAADANDEPQLDAIAARIEAEKKQLVNAAQFEYYRRIAGEVEARNVQTRHREQRNEDKRQRGWAEALGTPQDIGKIDAPWWTQDVPADKVVIVRSEGHGEGFKALSASAPASSDTIQPTDAFKAQAQAIGQRLRAELDRLGLKDIGLRISENLGMMVDGKMHAADGLFFQNLITIALDAENPDATLAHEAIHALRELSLFGKDEWAILERQSRKKWMAEHKIAEAYGAFPEWVQVEEGIAHAYGEWSRQGSGFDGIIAKAFRKIKAVLRAIARAFGKDFTSAEDVFAKIDSGEIGHRPGNVEFLSGGPKGALRSDVKEAQRSLLAEARDIAVKNGMPSTFVEDVYFVGSQAAGKGTPASDHDFVVRISGDMSDRAANDAWGALIDHFNQKKTVDIGGKSYKADIFVTDELYDGKPALGTQEKFALRRATAAPAPAQRRTTPPISILPNISTLTNSVSTRIMNAIKGGPGKNDGESIGDYSMRKIVDYLHPLREMIDSVGPVADRVNAYLEARLALDSAVASIQDMHGKFVTPAVEALTQAGASLDELHQYLYALHAEERNRVVGLRNEPGSDFFKAVTDLNTVGASGWSTNHARQVLRQLRVDPQKFAGIQQAGRLVRQMLDENLLAQKNAGLISDASYNSLSQQWQNYVPLQAEDGIDENGDFTMPGRGRGFDVRGKEFKGATGRFTEAENIPAWAISATERSKLRQAKNRVGKSILRFINQYDPMGTNLAEVYWSDTPAGGFGNIQKAPPVYKRELDASGKVVNKAVPYSTIAPDMYAAKVAGKTFYIKFADEKVGQALKNMNAVQMNFLFRLSRKITNFQSLVNTRINPAFTPTNFFRDVMTGGIHLLDEGFSGMEAAKILGNIPTAWGALWRSAKGRPGTGPMDTALAELTKAGGRLIFEQQKTVEESIKSLHSQMKAAAAGKTSPQALWQGLVKLVGDINDTVEMGIRLSSYVAARAKGKTVKESAFMIRDLTVDFRKHGEIGPTGNALFTFFNASVQGNFNVASRLLGSRKVQAAAATIALSGFMMDMLNRSLSGDDDDGENLYEKMLRNEPWKFERQMVIFYGPGKGSYFTIPLPYGYNAIYHMGVQTSAAANGDVTPFEAMSNTMRVTVDAFNPMGGGGGWVNMFAPTVLDPFIEIDRNKNFADIPIYPTTYPGDTTPDSQQSFGKTPDVFKWAAEQVNAATGGNKIEPGAVDIHPDTIEHMWDFVSGGLGRFFGQLADPLVKAGTGRSQDIAVEKLPFVRSFYGEQGDDNKRSEYYKKREAVQTAKSRLSDYKAAGDAAETQDFIERNKIDVESIGAFDAAEKRLRKIRKQRRRTEAEGGDTKALDEGERKAMDAARMAYARNAAKQR